MTTKGNPAVLDHDGIENEAASTSTLSESAENADGQNDRSSHALTSDEIRAFIGTSGDEIGEDPAIERDPDEPFEFEMDWVEREFNEQTTTNVDPVELSRRVAHRRQEVIDAAVAPHIESMLQHPPTKGHEWRDAYDRVYRRTGAGQAPTMQKVVGSNPVAGTT